LHRSCRAIVILKAEATRRPGEYSRYPHPANCGRTFTKKAELPAVPAASKKGASGKQQLDAKTIPPSADRLAIIVRFEPGLFPPCSFLSIAITLFPLMLLIHRASD
jgi:hypothetical protein